MSKEPDRNPRKALGKGLSALLSQRPTAAPGAATPAAEPAAAKETAAVNLPESFEEFQSLPLEQIEPSGEQPRDSFDGDKLNELSESIRANGLIQPITVYKVAEGRYQLIAGERRWRAARLAGWNEIPALVRTIEKDKVLELALIENIQREDLNPIEIALAFGRLASEHGLSHEQIAERTGKDRSTVTNFLRLLKLSPRVRDELQRGAITMGHARALLNITNASQQAKVCEQVIERQLSVRDTEALVKKLTIPQEPASDFQLVEEKREKDKLDPNIRAALDEMQTVLGTRVRMIPKANGAGKIEVEYYSADDLERIYSVIVKQ